MFCLFKKQPRRQELSRVTSEIVDLKPFPRKEVEGWIKTQQDFLKEAKRTSWANRKDSKNNAEAEVKSIEGYIRHLKYYLKHGDYPDMFYGPNGNQLISYRCVAMAYNNDGTIKRSENTFYADLGRKWTREDQKEITGTIEHKKKTRRSKNARR